jgi:hypothetical protein
VSNVFGEILINDEGGVFYFKGPIGKGNYDDTKLLCDSEGGVIPSIHSQEDADFLNEKLKKVKVTPRTKPFSYSFVWLSAVKKNETQDGNNTQAYEWEDGTPFDYHPWILGAPSCSEDCCAVVLVLSESPAGGHFSDLECSSRNVHQLCRMRHDLTQETHSMDSSLLHAIDNLNRTLLKTIQHFEEKMEDHKKDLSDAKFNIGVGIIFSFFVVIAFVIFVNRKTYLRHIYREEYNML